MQSEERKTAVIYVRVSSWEQVAGTSLEMQERLCREYAKRENLQVIACFIEEGESAKTTDRTKFQEALRFCTDKKKPVGYFIVHKLDRFARKRMDHVTTQILLQRYGTKLRSVTEQIDETPVGQMMEGILSTFAQFDNDVRTSRSKSGMMEKVNKGIWVWRPPLGYQRITKGGNLVVDDEIAPYIRMAFEEYAKGTYSFRSLADLLEKRGLRTRLGQKPCPQLMEKIIRNPAYRGVIKSWGHEYKASFQPIVDEELFLKCQLGKRRKLGYGKREHQNHNFPLRGLALCEECGQPITGSASTGRMGVKYPYYHHHDRTCTTARSIPKEAFEQEFIEYLQEISPKLKYEKIFKAIVLDIWQSNYKKLDSENARIRKEITSLEGERQRVFELSRSGVYNDKEFLEQKNLVNEKIYTKKQLLQETHIEEFNMEEALNHCFSLVRDSAKTWTSLADLPIHRQRFQKQIFPEKVTFDGKKFGTTKVSIVYKLNVENGTEKTHLVTLPGVEPGFEA